MKWPNSITIVRHGQSAYNILKLAKEKDPLYEKFKKAFVKDFRSAETKALAGKVRTRFSLGVGDYETPLTNDGLLQAIKTGKKIGVEIPKPDIILCSPYVRTRKTLGGIGEGWGIDISNAVIDDRIREQEHGLSLLYNDWRVFNAFHPEQKELRDLLGEYWYQYPQGESVSQVRDRIRQVTSTIIREYAGMNVFVVTHHLTILAIRANFERLSPEQFLELDKKQKPVNCGVTMYEGNPARGKSGKLELAFYNKCLY